ncbi:MAG: hypothetical protein D6B28_02040 [Gammaproteobacteria bacterium]|nr:MAG: hypothetical protein D6B28_02040 [Gammaproteobacteria bacterium]
MATNERDCAPAVVLGAGLNGLGVIRSLALGKVTIFLVDSDENKIAYRSKFANKQVVTDINSSELVPDLIKLASRMQLEFPNGKKPVLFFTEEASLNVVLQNRQELEEHYSIPIAASNLVSDLMDKWQFQKLAEKHNAPIPKSSIICSNSNLRDEFSAFPFPAVLKPISKHRVYSRNFKKAYKINSENELMEICLAIFNKIPPQEMILQQWIEGGDSDIYFCLQNIAADGRLISSFCGRKIRSWPIRVGGTASCTNAIEYVEDLTRITYKFFSDVGYCGIGGMEYKLDAKSGKLLMIEPTVGRTDLQHEITTLCGVNQTLESYLLANSIDPPQVQQLPNNITWYDPKPDKWAAQQSGIKGYPQGAKRYSAYFRWNDMGPGISSFMQLVKNRIKR